ncbi:ATP-dependent helicase HrpB [Roseibium sp. CAU 1637]|uniref:ATP-dependent helicase HrpB n=1 Tax=Roseibium limicola TaxID=2816037 RepID=A0A939ENJ5_9HYPH|nr:ATP-dependent helicase HrpB [Roseibium limicola]MBO0345658.1 ATP-dependent helicase HrpB [Roseibium limicola]
MTTAARIRAALPIDAVLPDLLRALETSPNAVLVADPGAGKTTRVPLALLDADWRGDGKILVLEPRRLAARAAARRMAQELGEKTGETVGYRVRLDSQVSSKTRIEVITEGIFTRMILDDPDLTGIAAVLFDEFHERSLDGDLGLALALEVQGALRDDIRLVPMSATLDHARVSTLLGDCPVIASKGRSFPVETHYLGRDTQSRIEPQMVRAIRKAVSEETGSILAFLPGQGEIKRVAEMLGEALPADCMLAPLYGGLDGRTQDLAIQPAPAGTRKIVLATAIAQTSLTIEGIRIVIDSGQSRVPRYEPQTGLTRLETVRVSRATADQRRGRAGRTEPGICYRLWDEAQTLALPAAEEPEIHNTDLAGLALTLAQWGSVDPSVLSFLDPPPVAAYQEAVSLLVSLGALDPEHRLTTEGKRMARLPLAPRLAHMVMKAVKEGLGHTACQIASLLSDPGPGGRDVDLRDRLRRLRHDKSIRARDTRQAALNWAALAGGDRKAIASERIQEEACGALLALAYPDRIAQARGQRGRFRLANGRGAELPEEQSLSASAFLVVADLQGKAAHGRIVLAAPIEREDIDARFAEVYTEDDEVKLDAEGRVRVLRVLRYGALDLESRTVTDPDPATLERAILTEVRRRGAERLPWTKDQKRLRRRVGYVRAQLDDASLTDIPDLSDAGLTATMDDWLAPYLAGIRHVSNVDADTLGAALSGLLSFDLQQRLEAEAPSHFTAPTGSRVPIDYGGETGPTVAIRVQELFGLTAHPAICRGKVPLTLELLSPAHRPIQITRDLPGFWAGSWRDVKADMKGRYPKHVWPDDPAQANPTARAKPRAGPGR